MAMGLMSKTTAPQSRFFVHFFAIPEQLQREIVKFQVYLRTGTARQ